MKLWLDDEREPPDDTWVWAQTADEAIQLLASGSVTEASLDHDLADEHYEGFIQSHIKFIDIPEYKERTGTDVVLWMAEHECWPTERIIIHSWNPVGGARMAALVDRYGPYEKRCQHTPAIQM